MQVQELQVLQPCKHGWRRQAGELVVREVDFLQIAEELQVVQVLDREHVVLHVQNAQVLALREHAHALRQLLLPQRHHSDLRQLFAVRVEQQEFFVH